ncbi:MAG: aminoacyl-tRNA hydrolase [Patescibacteria group bacterium]|nr:aminoacyl-tRNA hydrolase [Patescibacteria group bacterium]
MKLIIGLGNPGKKYENTKHNAGFLAVDLFADVNNLENFSENKKLKSEILKTNDYIIAKPLTFMNLSGGAVSLIKEYYKINIKDIIIVYDDLDIELGKIKSGIFESSAGHNGIKSIIEKLNSAEFTRIRIGIKNDEFSNIASEDIVLQKFNADEKEKINIALQETIKKIGSLL